MSLRIRYFSSAVAAVVNVALSIMLLGMSTLPTPSSASEFRLMSTGGVKPIYMKSRALIIGEQDYKNWDKLPTVLNEMQDLKAALLRQGFEKEDIQLLANPKAEQLKREIENFFNAPADSQTRLFLFFAGHGYTDGKSTGFIVAADAPARNHPDLGRYSMGMDVISLFSERSHAKHILMVFDSCFSGAVFLTRGAANLPSPLFIADAERPVRQFITSGSEFDEVPAQSEFIKEFIRGLDGAADTVVDGVITGNELGYWLKATLTPRGKQTPQYGSSTTQQFRHGDVMFAALNTPALAPGVAGTKQIPIASNGKRGPGSTASLPRQDYSGTQIYYYARTADRGRVERALDSQLIPYYKTRALRLPDRFEANAIACGANVSITVVKNIAIALTRGNVPVRAIVPMRRPETKKGRIEILSLSEDAGITPITTPPLTEEQISAMSDCRWLQNPPPGLPPGAVVKHAWQR